MIGLPGDSSRKALASAAALADLEPDFVRLYPTLVVRNSPLAVLYLQGRYRPLSLSRAIVLAGRVKNVFDRRAIPVIRMGLQHSEALTAEIVAGPHHAAFGELVLARQYFKQLRHLLAGRQQACTYQLSVAARDQSIFRGPGNVNWRHLQRSGHLDGVRVIFDQNIGRNAMRLARTAV